MRALLFQRSGALHLRRFLMQKIEPITIATAGVIESNGHAPAPETEELAQVVVSSASIHVPSRAWYLVLRPWLFCVVFLFLVELGTRLYFDRTLCLRRDRFDTFANAASED